MDEMRDSNYSPAYPLLFNSSLEVGLRTIVILESFFPKRLSISEILLFDYFVVHTGDIGGLESLHPEIAMRPAEYYIRRKKVEGALTLMRQSYMVSLWDEESGIVYEATEQAGVMLDLMNAPYHKKLKLRAHWLAEQANAGDYSQFLRQLRGTIEKWALELGVTKIIIRENT